MSLHHVAAHLRKCWSGINELRGGGATVVVDNFMKQWDNYNWANASLDQMFLVEAKRTLADYHALQSWVAGFMEVCLIHDPFININ